MCILMNTILREWIPVNEHELTGLPCTRREQAPGDAAIHWAATGSVTAVTAIAAVISYGHARELVLRYGFTGLAAYTLPLTIDGLVATCSLVLMDCARRRQPAPWHAWALLVTGAAAQVAANVAAGLSHGVVGRSSPAGPRSSPAAASSCSSSTAAPSPGTPATMPAPCA